jgi:hypothetical protein
LHFLWSFRAQQPLVGVEITSNGSSQPVQTNADGVVQFLLDEAPTYSFQSGATVIWTGPAATLARSMTFVQAADGRFSAQ